MQYDHMMLYVHTYYACMRVRLHSASILYACKYVQSHLSKTANHLWASHMKWHALFIEVDCDVSLLCVIVLFGAREAGCFREVAVLYSDGFDSTYTD